MTIPDNPPKVRIWLSASIPKNATTEDKNGISKFVELLTATCVREGWSLIHGSHPSIVPMIEDNATKSGAEPGGTGGPVLVRSEFFPITDEELITQESFCIEPVIRVPAVAHPEEQKAQRESLEELRKTLLAQSNVFIGIGGRWWDTEKDRAGVVAEMSLAYKDQLPVFLLAGFGGAVEGKLIDKDYLLRYCRNGLSDDENKFLSEQESPEEAIGIITDQIKRLPVRERLPGAGRPFRILSLDGGGIRGVFTARVLEEWEERTELRVADHFDLVAGTSTGGLLAIGLGLGRSAKELRQFYENEGPVIFPSDDSIKGMLDSLRHWFVSRYESSVLREKIQLALNLSLIHI